MNRTTLKIVSILVTLSMIIVSCGQPEYPKDIQEIIDKSPNKDQIIKLIKHYQKDANDSLKLKAAYFYVRGLNGHYYFDGDQLRHYKGYSEMVTRNFWHGEYIMNYLEKTYGEFSQQKLLVKYHINELNADTLIKDMDFAFKTWNEQPWKASYNFSYFCNYVLPFFIGNEVPEYTRESIYKRYSPLLDSLRKNNGSAIEAADLINDKLREEGWGFSFRQNNLPNLGPSIIIKYRVGNCREMANLATYIMRALAIPVGEDFLPQWPERNLGHNWNVLFTPDKKSHMFLGVDDDPSGSHFPGTKKGKVFRNTFEINRTSLGFLKDSTEEVPPFLANPFIEDVTDEYAHCFNTKVSLPLSNNFKHAYIAIFNDQDWLPVDWSVTKSGQANFNKVEGDIVYLPGFYQANKIVPGNNPFLLRRDGKMQFLIPDDKNTFKLVCDRISPVIAHYFDLNGLIGGTFQGANKADFSDAVTIYDVTEKVKPHLYLNLVNIPEVVKFRYIRYMKPRYKYSDGDLSEFHVYDSHLNEYTSRVIFPEGVDSAAKATGKNVVDGDYATAYLNKGKRPLAWVGLDLGRSRLISHLGFAAGTHDLNENLYIKPGHKYQLWIWKNGDWNVKDTQIAMGKLVTFSDVPKGALYRLHDATEQNRERIFIYEDGKVKFY